jgi:hypothetical protein
LTQATTPSMRDSMPRTAEWVDRMRAEHGRAYVNEQIRLALAGEPGHFYAIERGQVLGTPFPSTHPIDQEQRLAVLVGALFAGFIRTPEQGSTDGTH